MNNIENTPIIGTNNKILDFWKWAFPDVQTNSLRGIFAEFLVGNAIEAVNNPRIEWDAFDLVLKDKKIEVKSSAYIQAWHTKESKLSAISFDIGEKKLYDYETNKYSDDVKRHADLYVFCLLKETDHDQVNPLDTNQWEFYVVATKDLNKHYPKQGKLGLTSLKNIAVPITYDELKRAVEEINI